MDPAESSPDSVQGLFDRARSGDREALSALLEHYLPTLRAFAHLQMGSWLRPRESESDIVQSACAEALDDLQDLEYRGEEALRAWLCQIVRHKLQDRIRLHHAEKRDVRRELRPAMSGAQEAALLTCYRSFCTPSQELAAREQLSMVEAAFERLPEHYREVIALARIAGLSQSEIAAKMGRSIPSVRNILHRALARLAAHLDDLDPGCS